MPQFGNVPGDDSLGIAVQQRAAQARQQSHLTSEWGHPSFGPLPDPKWDGLFQAMQENGVDNVAGGGGPRPGHFVGVEHMPGEVNPLKTTPASGQHQNLMGYGAPDNATDLTVPQDKGRAALHGLNQAFKPNFSGGR